jgi:putative nucleotidyltransferase with HDIG domain
MFGFGQKKHRVSRSVARRAPETVGTKLRTALGDRGLLLRLGMAGIAIVLLVLGLESWRAPFSHRIGDVLPHGLLARVEFERVDEEATARNRYRAELAVPLIFRNDPQLLESLPQELKSALGEIAQAQRLNELSVGTRLDFGLENPGPAASPRLQAAAVRFGTDNPESRFNRLRAALVGSDMMMAQVRIEEIISDFSKFIAPLKTLGVIDPEELRRRGLDQLPEGTASGGITADHALLILSPTATSPEEGSRVLISQVRLEQQLNEAGALGSSWLSYPSLKQEIRGALSHWLMARVQPTLEFDQRATKEAIAKARNAVPDAIESYLVGDPLIRPGERLDEKKLSLLTDEFLRVEAQIPWQNRVARVVIVFLLLIALAGLNGYYIVHNEPRLIECHRHLLVYLAAIVVSAISAHWLSYDPLRMEMIPILFTTILLTIAYNQILSALTAFSLCLLLALSATGRFDQFVVLLSTCSLTIIPLDKVATRLTLLKVSFLAAGTYFLMQVGIQIVETQALPEVFGNVPLLIQAAKGSMYCLIACVLAAACLPFVESTFGIVTDLSLRELGDAHPLLQDLIRLAPGTYNHSQSVAIIAETAAERIGGNGLLVRVGAYFHDIGKMLKPNYFVENLQPGTESPHTHLSPAMSTLIIIGHVKDGVDLAEQHHLPQQIIDFIEQHHGTTLVEYFFREATRKAECQPDHRTDAEEASYRYPGPRPRTKEAAVLMIVDACESASRTLSEPTAKRLETLVHEIILRRLLDHQFDECALTMKELRLIEESVVKSLIGIYHGRIRYPDQPSSEIRRDRTVAETGVIPVPVLEEVRTA